MPNVTAWGFLSGTSFIVAADAARWLLASHPEASTARIWGVVAQLVLGVAVAIAAYRRGRSIEGGMGREGDGDTAAEGTAP